jgi:hypothetical protein
LYRRAEACRRYAPSFSTADAMQTAKKAGKRLIVRDKKFLLKIAAVQKAPISGRFVQI